MLCTPSPEKCEVADNAASDAVRKTFAILGVDVDNPQQVKEFQESLRFGEKLRAIADKSLIAFILAFVAASATAMIYGIGAKLKGQ